MIGVGVKLTESRVNEKPYFRVLSKKVKRWKRERIIYFLSSQTKDNGNL